ncbi:hypothetical protein ACYSNO_09700 [Enterococcus sp. LJL98]
MRKNSVRQLTISALLIAMGVMIPMVMPKIVIGPASFTLASHVPLFIAMFFSPSVAIAVALGTTFGFFVNGLPIVIGLRALSHLVFAVIGSLYLQKHPEITLSGKKFQIYNFFIGLIHSVFELVVVAAFLFGGQMQVEGSIFYFLFVLVGLGGLVHSMIDYNIAFFVVRSLSRGFEIPVIRKAKEEALS